MKKKSLKLNMIVNIVRVLLGKIFPLITFPYISRVLLPEGVGKCNFVFTFVYYFQLLSSLGISWYAIREGARKRDNKEELELFLNDILLLNLISMFVSYAILFISVILAPLEGYRELILIYSLMILFNTMGVDYIFSIFEEFTYIAFRSFLMQLLSLVALILLVKDSGDALQYVIISACAQGASNIFNFFYSRKFVTLFRFRSVKYLKRHLKPVLIIFALTLSSTICNNIDTVMLTLFRGDVSTGLYSAAIKINTSVSSIIHAVSGVMLPRSSYYLENGEKDKFQNIIVKVMKYYLFAIVAVTVGLFPISYYVIDIFCGSTFYSAGLTMKIMLLVLFFSMLNGYISFQICMPCKREAQVLKTTVIGALFNFITNVYLIPRWAENGAAFTTLLTEILMFIILIYHSKDIIKYKKIFNELWQMMFSSIGFVITYYVLNELLNLSELLVVFCVIILGGGLYCGILLLVKNSTAIWLVGELKQMGRKVINRKV